MMVEEKKRRIYKGISWILLVAGGIGTILFSFASYDKKNLLFYIFILTIGAIGQFAYKSPKKGK